MNDLLYRTMFGFLIADRQGVERNEAFKIGLLGSIDNSRGFVMPVLSAKLMADDKVEIENRKKAEKKIAADFQVAKGEMQKLEGESKALAAKLAEADKKIETLKSLESPSMDLVKKIFDANPPTIDDLKAEIAKSVLIKFKP